MERVTINCILQHRKLLNFSI